MEDASVINATDNQEDALIELPSLGVSFQHSGMLLLDTFVEKTSDISEFLRK